MGSRDDGSTRQFAHRPNPGPALSVASGLGSADSWSEPNPLGRTSSSCTKRPLGLGPRLDILPPTSLRFRPVSENALEKVFGAVRIVHRPHLWIVRVASAMASDSAPGSGGGRPSGSPTWPGKWLRQADEDSLGGTQGRGPRLLVPFAAYKIAGGGREVGTAGHDGNREKESMQC